MDLHRYEPRYMQQPLRYRWPVASYAALLMIVALFVMPTIGCSGKPQATYPVSGVVQWADGSPASELAGAAIGLRVIEGPEIIVNPRGELGPDGSFVLKTYDTADGAPAGKYTVAVIQYRPRSKETRVSPPLIMDPKFQSYDSSPLEVTIEPTDSNQLTLTVERAKTR